ncbi:M48 family metallopeptidase [Taibaiella chishuiensis]|uniref:Peptidase M48-like protein n=1 Tax=Taibaiella chishuiensis TaxID=1434707 RepID=A0A2P8D5U3_9BACT|nr:M48 family metallopeptidase [Taibaiella chishuiensis]PSK92586.1 peptidase M48-like protein [Taibaiella chishuiensis]
MKSLSLLRTLALAAVALSAPACYRNPVTGRSSLNLVDEGTLNNMSQQQYTSFMATNKPVNGTGDATQVKRVGEKLAAAINRYFASKGQSSVLNGYKWEFNLVNSKEANAWCMPGGKVVVYSGILPVTKTEAGLAVVMGHEIAHAIARHGNERMSQGLVQQAGGAALSVALANKPAETQQLFNTAYGVTSNVVGILPYSRKHESEADEMGLIFMAMAGYDPNEAVAFWQRMAALGGSKPPELLSTHPGDQTRIDQIKKLIPKAMQYYTKN